jgi:hypothetical protein
MSKTILSMLAAVLVCMAAQSARADQRISSSTLDEMGLSGLITMSDSDGMAVRGMGYSHDNYAKKKDQHNKKKSSKPWAAASGKSWANVEYEGEKVDVDADAGSRNEYAAEGHKYASGDNGSDAELVKSWTTRTDWGDGDYVIEKKTFKINVSAGGWSSAKAY